MGIVEIKDLVWLLAMLASVVTSTWRVSKILTEIKVELTKLNGAFHVHSSKIEDLERRTGILEADVKGVRANCSHAY